MTNNTNVTDLKFGGFPLLVKKNNNKNNKQNNKKNNKQTELKSQFFSNVKRENINIREILNNKTSLVSDSESQNELVELDSI